MLMMDFDEDEGNLLLLLRIPFRPFISIISLSSDLNVFRLNVWLFVGLGYIGTILRLTDGLSARRAWCINVYFLNLKKW